jgi:uncharacterized repeat protein (TIGR03803 family)
MKKFTLILSILILTFSVTKAQNTLGKLWGMTYQGGDSNGSGIIFNYDSITPGINKLKSFAPSSNGNSPDYTNLIIGADGNLYGLTSNGGASNSGTLFKYNPTTGVYTVMINFNGTNGSSPQGSLLLATDGNMYGMTYGGGTNNAGTIFQFIPSTGVLNTWFSFTNSEYPTSSFIQATDGNLYATTIQGGTSGYGEIIKLNINTQAESIVYSFAGGTADGSYPYGSLMQASNDSLYGMTYNGGKYGNGVIYEFNIVGGTYDTIYSFSGSSTDGANPYGALLQAKDGSLFLYGMTYQGGSSGNGMLFKYNITTPGITDLNDFTNNEYPYGNLIEGSDNNFYGMTNSGGTNGYGLVFQYNYLTPTYTVLASFNDVNGANPYGGLVQTPDNVLYGLTNSGGAQGSGNIFKCTTTGTLTNLFNFASSAIGYAPYGSFIQASDGNMYGMTNSGGSWGYGSIVKYNTASGVTTSLGGFTDTNGATPYGNLIQAKDGNFYGVTSAGGAANNGMLFKYDTTLHIIDTVASFLGVNGSNPHGSLIQAKDGNFYGTTNQGGANNQGTVFKYDTTAKTLNALASFSKNTNGAGPYGTLVQAFDGNFYGTATSSSDGDGVIFECTPAGSLTQLVQFTFNAGADSGKSPYGSMVMSSVDSNLYGLAYDGGKNYGMMYKYNIKKGTYKDLIDFTTNSNGMEPYNDLMEASDGQIYGMTTYGGANGDGSIFEYTTSGTFTTLASFNQTNDGSRPHFGTLTEQMSDAVIDSLHGCAGVKLTARFRGAKAPFKVKWSTGDSTISINAPVAGTYSYTVTDARGIQLNANISTIFNAVPVTVNITGGGSVCSGTPTPLTANVTSGSPTYTYSWSTSGTRDTIMVKKVTLPGSGIVTTLAGDHTQSGFIDGTGSNAQFANPFGVASDGHGNLYVADDYVIRKIVTATGVVTTLAGTAYSNGNTDGTGTAAQFNSPTAIAYDGKGNLYVADNNNNEIRKIVVATGVVTTFAGSAASGAADGIGTAATFYYPQGLAYGNGNLYVADYGNNRIRQIDISTGAVTTLAGSTSGYVDGVGTAAKFNEAVGLAYDSKGYLYVADANNNKIRKIDLSSANVTTLVGSSGGSADGIGSAAQFNYPFGLAYDGNNNLYVMDDGNNEIRKLNTTTAAVVTFAGSLPSGYADGQGGAAAFNNSLDLAMDANGVLYVADQGNHEIRKVTVPNTYMVTVTDGNGCQGSALSIATVYPGVTAGINIKNSNNGGVVCTGALDTLVAAVTGTGTVKSYTFNWSNGATGDSVIVTASNTYSVSLNDSAGCPATASKVITMNATPTVSVTGTTRICTAGGVLSDTITATATGAATLSYNWSTNGTYDTVHVAPSLANVAMVSTVAGSTSGGYIDGAATAAQFSLPYSLTTDGAGNVYIADQGNNVMRKINTATGIVTTLAGNANIRGANDGIGLSATFNNIIDAAYDGSGNLFVVDNYQIRKIVVATGVVTTFAGNVNTNSSIDGTGTAAGFSSPNYITYDGSGNLFVSDRNEIRQIVIATGAVTTLAGSSSSGFADGTGTAAKFHSLFGMVCDGAGNLYVSDEVNQRIRKIVTATGVVTTLAGSGSAGLVNGTGTAAKFDYPTGITYDGNGNLYVVERLGNDVRKVVISSAQVSTYAGSVTGVSGSTNGAATVALFNHPYGINYGGGNLYVADRSNNMIRKIVLPNTYSVIVTDGNGCMSGASLNVAVNTTPTVTVSANVIGGTTICTGLKDTLMAGASGNGSFTYNWSTTSTKDTTLVGSAGNYTVTVTDANKCVSTATVSVSVNPSPTVNVSGRSTINIGGGDTLTASGTSVTYVWTSGSTSDTTIIKPLTTTTYTVTGTDGNGCKGTNTFTVTVGPTSVSNVVASNTTTLYPNPTISVINLSFEMQGVGVPAEVKIIDGIGREVMDKNTTIGNGKVLTLDVSMLAQGMYYVKVVTNNNTQVEKFIKQ